MLREVRSNAQNDENKKAETIRRKCQKGGGCLKYHQKVGGDLKTE